MDRKLAREHLTQVKRAIIELGYDCMGEWFEINQMYRQGVFNTNQDLHEATSRMMCKARFRKFN